MQFHRKKKDKNKQKSHKSLFESLSKNTWKHMELKYLDRPSIKPGTRNIPEHAGTFRNIPEHPGTSRNMKKLKYFFMKKWLIN